MKLHKIINDFFDNGRVKYHAGRLYVPTEETARMVAQQHAEEVDGDASSAWQPAVDPDAVATRKQQLQAQIAAAQKELDEIEKSTPAPEAPAKAAPTKGADKGTDKGTDKGAASTKA